MTNQELVYAAKLREIISEAFTAHAGNNQALISDIAGRIQFPWSAGTADVLFRQLETLAPEILLPIVDSIEKMLVESMTFGPKEKLRTVREVEDNRFRDGSSSVLGYLQAISCMFEHAARIKGANADPFTLVFVQDKASQPQETFNSWIGILQTMITAYELTHIKEFKKPTPNPFRHHHMI